jgi:hypothetical protein
VPKYDASRPVPWARLLRLFLVYAVIANAVFLLFFRQDYGWGTIIGTVAGGVAYLAIAAMMVKFGWDPPMLRARQNAADAKAKPTSSTSTSGKPAPAADRAKPAPTKRTNAGNPKAKRR